MLLIILVLQWFCFRPRESCCGCYAGRIGWYGLISFWARIPSSFRLYRDWCSSRINVWTSTSRGRQQKWMRNIHWTDNKLKQSSEENHYSTSHQQLHSTMKHGISQFREMLRWLQNYSAMMFNVKNWNHDNETLIITSTTVAFFVANAEEHSGLVELRLLERVPTKWWKHPWQKWLP